MRAEPGSAVVELGAGCGRSLACICEAVPHGVEVHSYDTHEDTAQSYQGHDAQSAAPIPAPVARELWCLTQEHFWKKGVVTALHSEDSAKGAASYVGPTVSVLFVDDHHSEEQVRRNLIAWRSKLMRHSVVLFHDYTTLVYGILRAANALLPEMGFSFIGVSPGSIVGVWKRGQ